MMRDIATAIRAALSTPPMRRQKQPRWVSTGQVTTVFHFKNAAARARHSATGAVVASDMLTVGIKHFTLNDRKTRNSKRGRA